MPIAGPVRSEGPRRRLQVLVRPEDVALRHERDELEHPLLGSGEVVETAFSGSTERLRVRLPALPGVRVIHPPAPFGDDHLAVDATRPQHAARREPLEPGDRVWVGVRRLHALLHPGLSFVAVGAGAADEVATELARLAQARLTRLGSVAELGERVAGEPPDLVIAVRPAVAANFAEELLEASGDSNLLLVREARPLPPQRFLIAVAVGEPGKEDVAFVGRLARHLGAPATVLNVLGVDADAAEAAASQRFLAGCVRTLGRWGVAAEPEAAHGSLAAAIGLRMESLHDLLAIGSPLPDAEGRMRWGRATRVLLDAPAPYPVLVVRAHAREVAGA